MAVDEDENMAIGPTV